MFWRMFYNSVIVPAGWLVFRIVGIFDRKARRGIEARKTLFEKLEGNIRRLDTGRSRVWFHSSSMGEFEQAKPIIAALRKRKPEIQVIVSFFSPSGYEHSLSYKSADIITYIPFDSARNAARFVALVKPTAAVIVRYDVWPNHVWALNRAGIPTFIANATFQQTALRKLPAVKQCLREMYNSIDWILTVSENDKQAFDMFHLDHPQLEVVGDTRFDQVWARSADARRRQFLPEHVTKGRTTLVIGSSWPEDEERLIPACVRLSQHCPELLVIIVPHEPTLETLEKIEGSLEAKISSIRFSNLTGYNGETVVIVDSVGILMALYQYAQVAYVGGSFRQGIHNVLEPAAYGVPIVIGPRYDNSREAVELVRQGAIAVGQSSEELLDHLLLLCERPEECQRRGQIAYKFVQTHTGATERFLTRLGNALQDQQASGNEKP